MPRAWCGEKSQEMQPRRPYTFLQEKSDGSHANLLLPFPLVRMQPIPHQARNPRKAEAEWAEHYQKDNTVTSATAAPKEQLLGT